jgi:hypothetical protein
MLKIWYSTVIALCILGCSSTPKKKVVKKPENKQGELTIHLFGHDSLDVNLAYIKPLGTKKTHQFELTNLDKSGYHNWKDTSWTNVSSDSCLTKILRFLHDQPFRKAQNATYEYKNNRWELKDAIAGSEIDTAALREQLLNGIENGLAELDLRTSGLYLDPKYTKDSQELKAAKRLLETALNTTVDLSHGGAHFTLNKDKFAKWLSLDEKLKVKVDYISAQNFIQDIARKIEKPMSEILAAYEQNKTSDTAMTNTFPRMHIFQEVDFLLASIPTGKSFQREISFVNQGLPNGLRSGLADFVEVSILDQKLWLFKGGQLVLETDVVTGNERHNTATPRGNYKVYAKTKDRVLRGPGYASFVKYWMPFHQGYGMHDATWRSRFGANIYQTGGSHGCVNLPPKIAPLVFENVEVGMDVIIR